MDAENLAQLLGEAAKLRAPAGVRMRTGTQGWAISDAAAWLTSVEVRDGLVRVETENRDGPHDCQVIDPAEVAIVYWLAHEDGGPAPAPDSPGDHTAGYL